MTEFILLRILSVAVEHLWHQARKLKRCIVEATPLAWTSGNASHQLVYPRGSVIMNENNLRVEAVRTRQDIEEFIRFPFKLYPEDPNWVPSLLSERRKFLDPEQNPFFDHADVALWLARRNDEVVGTISSHLDYLHNQIHGEQTGMFGFFEAVNDYAVAEALLSTARDWVREQGMTSLRGPLSFSQNHECGLLVDGFDGPPMVMMTYNPRYYIDFYERFGLAKAMDLYAYIGDLAQFERDPGKLPTKLVRVTDKVKKRIGIITRPASMKDFDAEIARAEQVYNQAWEKNWGFVPMTEAEIEKVAADLKQIIDPDLAIVAEIDGKAVGVSVAIPDINQVLKHLNGRLFPFGWLKALWYARKITGVRLMIMGVVHEYRGRGIEALLIAETLKAAVLNGYQSIELSWILENNDMMNRITLNIGKPYGTHIYRTYRIYQMPVE
jgi:GNAT superfamily N-acetyltransferase